MLLFGCFVLALIVFSLWAPRMLGGVPACRVEKDSGTVLRRLSRSEMAAIWGAFDPVADARPGRDGFCANVNCPYEGGATPCDTGSCYGCSKNFAYHESCKDAPGSERTCIRFKEDDGCGFTLTAPHCADSAYGDFCICVGVEAGKCARFGARYID